MTQSIADLRRRILNRRDIKLEKHTRKPLLFEQVPDEFHKTPKMKYLELKYHLRLEHTLHKGSLLDICKLFHWEVDRSTVSRWRKYIRNIIVVTEGEQGGL